MASDRTPAAERLAAMTAGPHSTTAARPPGMTLKRWNLLSAPVQGRFPRAMDNAFYPVLLPDRT
jgi:hypothetical protein